MDDPGERLATAQAQNTQEDGEVMTQQEAQLASRLWSGGTSPSHSDRRALSLEAEGMILVSLSARRPEAKLSQEIFFDSEPFNITQAVVRTRETRKSQRGTPEGFGRCEDSTVVLPVRDKFFKVKLCNFIPTRRH